ncbi:Uncharacterised protein [Bordetella pertussis]|nr:Uncharacterised protein [Bordetella pertussis]CFO10256.1 Uncharacterised protein [Bordetella pertussis]CFO77783.1 Uncharacterised protein [Bordetella pertussis]CFP63922.1 Uncharacterised protein [Bordetella pertussis]CFU88157.1 Uncharacterised protein [Bordetella pertussis]
MMRLLVEYDVAAAIHELIAPASLMPSCSSWPSADSL